MSSLYSHNCVDINGMRLSPHSTVKFIARLYYECVLSAFQSKVKVWRHMGGIAPLIHDLGTKWGLVVSSSFK